MRGFAARRRGPLPAQWRAWTCSHPHPAARRPGLGRAGGPAPIRCRWPPRTRRPRRPGPRWPRRRWAAGFTIEGYAYARTGYHRGLDALRKAGWRGTGPVPWSHAPNQGFLRALHCPGAGRRRDRRDRRGRALREVPGRLRPRGGRARWPEPHRQRVRGADGGGRLPDSSEAARSAHQQGAEAAGGEPQSDGGHRHEVAAGASSSPASMSPTASAAHQRPPRGAAAGTRPRSAARPGRRQAVERAGEQEHRQREQGDHLAGPASCAGRWSPPCRPRRSRSAISSAAGTSSSAHGERISPIASITITNADRVQPAAGQRPADLAQRHVHRRRARWPACRRTAWRT